MKTKYAELIQFEPIESVVQLREADSSSKRADSSRPSSSPSGWRNSSAI